jgi:hypothetical protein
MPDTSSSQAIDTHGLYPYQSSKALPIIFPVIISISLILRTYQNLSGPFLSPSYTRTFNFKRTITPHSHHHFWRIIFCLFYANTASLSGFILCTVFSFHRSNLCLYIAQFILIYAAAEYKVLGRLLSYTPQHSSMNPHMEK